MTQPPKMSPLALQSAGMGITLSTNSMLVGKSTWALELVDMGDNLPLERQQHSHWILTHAPLWRTCLHFPWAARGLGHAARRRFG
jgi:hypothetical protein